MAKLYYGNGECNIEGANIKGVQIHFRGNIEIVDKTPTGYELMMANNQILIFSLTSIETLNTLFTYQGSLNIQSVIVADINAQKIHTTIKKVMDYAELLDSNAEDLTIKSEDLKAGYKSGNRTVSKSYYTPMITNLNTEAMDGRLYLEDGTEYNGDFHVHKKDSGAMTGAVHDSLSQSLFIISYKGKLLPTKNPSHMPLAKIHAPGGLKGEKINNRLTSKIRKSGGGGY